MESLVDGVLVGGTAEELRSGSGARSAEVRLDLRRIELGSEHTKPGFISGGFERRFLCGKRPVDHLLRDSLTVCCAHGTKPLRKVGALDFKAAPHDPNAT
jgi:hypothetical protein